MLNWLCLINGHSFTPTSAFCGLFLNKKMSASLWYWLFSLFFAGHAHFVRGQQYWKFSSSGMNLLEGYPRYIGIDFFSCRSIWARGKKNHFDVLKSKRPFGIEVLDRRGRLSNQYMLYSIHFWITFFPLRKPSNVLLDMVVYCAICSYLFCLFFFFLNMRLSMPVVCYFVL